VRFLLGERLLPLFEGLLPLRAGEWLPFLFGDLLFFLVGDREELELLDEGEDERDRDLEREGVLERDLFSEPAFCG